MKNLHRLALLALVAATSFGTAAAQTATTPPPPPPPPPPQDAPPPPPDGKGEGRERIQRRLDELAEKLGLTQGQKDQVKMILIEAGKQTKALFADQSLSQEDRMGKMKDIHEASHEKIRALLTPDQQKTFDAMKEHEHHHPPADGAPAPTSAS